jgi:transposase
MERPGRTEAENFGAFLAIDWADQRHFWALQAADLSRWQEGEVESSPEAIDVWVSALLARYPGQRIAVALEQKRGALLCLLSKYEGLVLYPVHPATVSRMRAALYPSASKDDPKDARLLLEILLHHREHLRRLDADTVETRKLQALVEDRRKLVDDQTGYGHQLRARLKVYFPQAVRWLGEMHAPMTGEFLRRWPTLESLQRARIETIRRFFHRHNCRNRELLQQRLEEIPRGVVATRDEAIVDSSVTTVRALVALLAVVREQIAEFDRRIALAAAAHPDFPIFDSLPGAGPVMAPRLIAAMGSQRDRFESACDLQASSGIAPVQQCSGQSEWIHFRYACSKFLRQTFHEWAGHSIPQCAWAKAYYDQQIARGKGHHAATRALAFKWQRIIFRCWKDRQPYNESKYLQSLQRRGSWLAAA